MALNAGGRLAVYGAGLVVAFGGAYLAAGALVPERVVEQWADHSAVDEHAEDPVSGAAGHGGGAGDSARGGDHAAGLALASDGFALSPVSAPSAVGESGELTFQILGESGDPATSYTLAHEKDLHLIVVRTDGTEFRHVHPELDPASGTWSIPWQWDAAGTYRVYADFTPAGHDAGLTLSRLVEVAGEFAPVEAEPRRIDVVDGYTVTLEGDLAARESTDLTLSVERDGESVTTLEPYLGAFGHLVVLRGGDLAYLHAHAEGAEPRAGDHGAAITFGTKAPTAGRYLLYLDFQVDGQVRTAQFVLDSHDDDAESPRGRGASDDH